MAQLVFGSPEANRVAIIDKRAEVINALRETIRHCEQDIHLAEQDLKYEHKRLARLQGLLAQALDPSKGCPRMDDW